MKHTYITKRCNAVDAFADIFDDVQKHLMAYDLADFYHLFQYTTSTYALRYRFTSKINSVAKLLGALNSIGTDLKGRDVMIHIIYPQDTKFEELFGPMEAIQSSYQTQNNEIVYIQTKKQRIKFWQVNLYLFDEHLIDVL